MPGYFNKQNSTNKNGGKLRFPTKNPEIPLWGNSTLVENACFKPKL